MKIFEVNHRIYTLTYTHMCVGIHVCSTHAPTCIGLCFSTAAVSSGAMKREVCYKAAVVAAMPGKILLGREFRRGHPGRDPGNSSDRKDASKPGSRPWAWRGRSNGTELSCHTQTNPGIHVGGQCPHLRPALGEPPDVVLGHAHAPVRNCPGSSAGAEGLKINVPDLFRKWR